MAAPDDDFVEFAETTTGRLHRAAYLLCHDWHLAQDLTQSTLTKTYACWPQVSRAENLEERTRKILLRTFLDHRRVRLGIEVPTCDVPGGSYEQRHDLRLTLLAAVDRLPDRDRSIVLLRYWEDHSVRTVAELLRLPTSIVKTQSFRALARLRVILDDERAVLFDD